MLVQIVLITCYAFQFDKGASEKTIKLDAEKDSRHKRFYFTNTKRNII